MGIADTTPPLIWPYLKSSKPPEGPYIGGGGHMVCHIKYYGAIFSLAPSVQGAMYGGGEVMTLIGGGKFLGYVGVWAWRFINTMAF